MVVLNFRKWRRKATSMFLCERVYKDGFKWTPICVVRFRYVG